MNECRLREMVAYLDAYLLLNAILRAYNSVLHGLH